jgi:singapore isolate B (sub-type 7) whole genome shotgun sequence assembly, scaffold_6
LISRLLIRDPALRLGAGIADAEEVKAHPFFEGLDWKALERKEIPPPWKPNLVNETDTSYFNKKYTYADIDEATPPVGIRIG